VIELNERALTPLRGPAALEIIPGASHLFPEPGTLEAVIGSRCTVVCTLSRGRPAGGWLARLASVSEFESY